MRERLARSCTTTLLLTVFATFAWATPQQDLERAHDALAHGEVDAARTALADALAAYPLAQLPYYKDILCRICAELTLLDAKANRETDAFAIVKRLAGIAEKYQLTATPEACLALAERLLEQDGQDEQDERRELGLAVIDHVPLFAPETVRDLKFQAAVCQLLQRQNLGAQAVGIAMRAFALCAYNTESVSRAAELVTRNLFIRSLSAKSAEPFVEFQKTGRRTEGVPETPAPRLSDAAHQALVTASREHPQYRTDILLYLGQYEPAMEALGVDYANAPTDAARAAIIHDLARCLKARDGHLILANSLVTYAQRGVQGGKLAVLQNPERCVLDLTKFQSKAALVRAYLEVPAAPGGAAETATAVGVGPVIIPLGNTAAPGAPGAKGPAGSGRRAAPVSVPGVTTPGKGEPRADPVKVPKAVGTPNDRTQADPVTVDIDVTSMVASAKAQKFIASWTNAEVTASRLASLLRYEKAKPSDLWATYASVKWSERQGPLGDKLVEAAVEALDLTTEAIRQYEGKELAYLTRLIASSQGKNLELLRTGLEQLLKDTPTPQTDRTLVALTVNAAMWASMSLHKAQDLDAAQAGYDRALAYAQAAGLDGKSNEYGDLHIEAARFFYDTGRDRKRAEQLYEVAMEKFKGSKFGFLAHADRAVQQTWGKDYEKSRALMAPVLSGEYGLGPQVWMTKILGDSHWEEGRDYKGNDPNYPKVCWAKAVEAYLRVIELADIPGAPESALQDALEASRSLERCAKLGKLPMPNYTLPARLAERLVREALGGRTP